jgi:acyl carrier protein
VFAAEEALDVEFPEDALTKLKGIRALTDAAVAYFEAA